MNFDILPISTPKYKVYYAVAPLVNEAISVPFKSIYS
jgi:hypothetical protein